MGSKSRTGETTFQTSFRLPQALKEFLEGEAKGGALSLVALELLEGVRTYWSSAIQDRELFEADAKRLKLTRSQHLNYILTEYRNNLVAQRTKK